MLNIYNFGSCRTRFFVYNKIYFNQYRYIKSFDLTHTTKEVLSFLDLLDGVYDYNTYREIEKLIRKTYLSSNKSLVGHKRLYKQCNFVTIEISSLKCYIKNGFYYQSNRLTKEEKEYMLYKQTEDEFKQDIQELYKRINVPIIFIGHLNLNFYDSFEKTNGRIKERVLLDDYIKKYCKHYVLPSEVLKDFDYKDILDNGGKLDITQNTTHFNGNSNGQIALFKAVCKKIEEIRKR